MELPGQDHDGWARLLAAVLDDTTPAATQRDDMVGVTNRSVHLLDVHREQRHDTYA